MPKGYYKTMKAQLGKDGMEYYNNLLQLTIGTHGMIFDLDARPPKEVDTIENIDQLMKPDSFCNTGFIMSISRNVVREEMQIPQRKQIFTNEYCSLLFEKKQLRFPDGRREFKISGMLYRTFSDMDLYELNQIVKNIEGRQRMSYIDPEAIVSSYQGHTIFSIFFDRIDVYEQI